MIQNIAGTNGYHRNKQPRDLWDGKDLNEDSMRTVAESIEDTFAQAFSLAFDREIAYNGI